MARKQPTLRQATGGRPGKVPQKKTGPGTNPGGASMRRASNQPTPRPPQRPQPRPMGGMIGGNMPNPRPQQPPMQMQPQPWQQPMQPPPQQPPQMGGGNFGFGGMDQLRGNPPPGMGTGFGGGMMTQGPQSLGPQYGGSQQQQFSPQMQQILQARGMGGAMGGMQPQMGGSSNPQMAQQQPSAWDQRLQSMGMPVNRGGMQQPQMGQQQMGGQGGLTGYGGGREGMQMPNMFSGFGSRGQMPQQSPGANTYGNMFSGGGMKGGPQQDFSQMGGMSGGNMLGRMNQQNPYARPPQGGFAAFGG